MSVLLNFAMFPTDKGISVSKYVSEIIKMISENGYSYSLNSMGTIVETENLQSALNIINKSYEILEPVSDRVYVSANIDIRKGKTNRISEKINSIKKII